MVLQRLEGLSDREAVDRFTFDARWRYAAGVGGWDGAGPAGFAHTVLVDMRERLRRSDRPDRVFEVALTAAREAGLVGRRRVLDSTPLYDAVATMDTVTLIRSAIRGLLGVGSILALEQRLRAVLTSGDHYVTAASRSSTGTTRPPATPWSTPGPATATPCCTCWTGTRTCPSRSTRQRSCWPRCSARTSKPAPTTGGWRIARRVAKDRVISTVDPQARHGHKTNHRGFDGYKGHIAIDPDSEIITATRSPPATPATPSPSPT